jgi:hypothetical protein
MVSVLGAGFVVAAAFAYTQLVWPVSAALGMALHMTWHVVDGADGDLARMTGRSSPIGEMVDGLCDYLSHAVLYIVLAAYLAGSAGAVSGWQAWALVTVAGLSHAVQSNHVEVQRRQYQNWVYGTPWLRNSHAAEGSATSTRTIRPGWRRSPPPSGRKHRHCCDCARCSAPIRGRLCWALRCLPAHRCGICSINAWC